MHLQTPRSALLLFFFLLLFLLGANGVKLTSCPTIQKGIRVKEGTSGVIMEPPADGIGLKFVTSAAINIIYNVTTKELTTINPLQINDSGSVIDFFCTSAAKNDSFSVVITVLQVNNLLPIWKVNAEIKNLTTVSIDENKIIPLVLPQIECDGRDGNSVDNLTLKIIKSAFSEHFQITSQGNLLKMKVVKGLDYEKSSSVLQTIRCEDRNETGSLIGTADFSLTVTVKNLPEKGLYTFNYTAYSATISLDKVAPGKALTLSPGPLGATNSLADGPTEPIFAIEPITQRPADNGLFEIDNKTGIISITRKYPEPRVFEFRVKVSVLNDNSPDPKTNFTTVRVEFKPPAGLILQFEPTSILPMSVPEKTLPNRPLRTVRVNYAYVSYQPQNVAFEVETHKDTFYFEDSALKLRRPLDFEKNDKVFSVKIKASDNNITASNTTFLNITVIDANDSAPKFAQSEYRFKVAVTGQKNSFVGRVEASDMDTNSVLTFVITGNNSHPFKINRTAGDIFLITDGKYLNKTIYSFVVKADDGVNHETTLVTIDVYGKTVSRANISTVAVAALGATVFLILLVSLVGFCCFKHRAEARRKKQMDSRPPGDSLYYSETGMTALQENPVYTNDFEDGGIDMGMFKGDRDVSEIELYDSGDVVGPPSHGGTLHTGMSNTLSSFQNSAPRMQNGHSIRLSNNMELVSADNAVYSEAMDEVTAEPKDELTIYY